jgi:hypothetical protein
VERGAWSVERGAWSVERGAWSVERGAWSVERKNCVFPASKLTSDNLMAVPDDRASDCRWRFLCDLRLTTHDSRLTTHDSHDKQLTLHAPRFTRHDSSDMPPLPPAMAGEMSRRHGPVNRETGCYKQAVVRGWDTC